MKIDNYAVSMNAQYFNVQQEQSEVVVSTTTEDFETNESLEVSNIEKDSQLSKDRYDELSVELSKVLLKNINAEANTNMLSISYEYTEMQSLNFQAQAYIKTDDKEIELSLDVSLSRSFTQMANINILDLGILKEPLVLSLDGTMPTLSSNTFSFDIDSDGERYQVSKLAQGNGFLALDKNSNGIIDNGNELFGTKSGDGFADLTEYDDDKNGWIDENDAIFNKLRIWQKTDTEDKLIGLGEVGVGAIFLGRTETPFSLKSETNKGLGEMLTSGIFLYENGRAGVISQIDLIVNKETENSLSQLNGLQKDVSSLNLENTYKENSDMNKGEEKEDKRIDKLQKQLKTLENKLANAKEDNKSSLQAEIGAVSAQIMAILSEDFT